MIVGCSLRKRETLSTTVMDAEPEHRHQLAEDSLWPFILAVLTNVAITVVIFHPAAFPAGLALACPILFAWFWRGAIFSRNPDAPKPGELL